MGTDAVQQHADLADGCYVNYTRSSNKVMLRNDASTAWLGAVVLGSATVLENSRCKLTPATSTQAAGANLTVTLALLFKARFAGIKNIYMQAKDNGGLGTYWQSRGTWTVPGGRGGGKAPRGVGDAKLR